MLSRSKQKVFSTIRVLYDRLDFLSIYGSSHPQWTKTFTLNYEYGSECYFFVQIFRFVDATEEPVPIGNAVCEISDILGTKNNTKVKRLPKGGV